MRKLILGMSAVALLGSAATFADDQDNTRLAAADITAANFTKLDADADGRISAIEAATNSKLAAAFTAADTNRDGYLSKAEYAQIAKTSSATGATSSRSSSSQPDSRVPADNPETGTAPK